MKKIYRFTASWCAPCQVLAKNIEQAELEVLIEVVDIDVHTELAAEYNIRSVPTLVLLEDGKETKRAMGMMTSKQLKEWVIKND